MTRRPTPSVTRTPVLVIDLQVAMFDGRYGRPIHDSQGIEARARAVIAWARATGHPLAFIRHDGPPGDPLAPRGPGWPVWPPLGQAEGEPTFAKTVADAFSNPDLGTWLGPADAVILLGAETSECIAGTVAGALTAGLAVSLVADGHSQPDWPGHPATEAIARHNADFAARGVRLVTAAELTAG
jgi:nicotinamidase-related amidase